jgi:hypothetical protein
MIEILPPLEKYKYNTWRILPVKCYIDNFVRLRSCIQNINKEQQQKMKEGNAMAGAWCREAPNYHTW